MPDKYRLLLSLSFLVLFVCSGCVTVKEEPKDPVAAWILKLLPDSPQVRRQKLMERLGSSDADKRREGVIMLGKGDAPTWDATPKILRIMARGDQDGQVRAAAIQVMVKSYQVENIMDTLTATSKDSSALVRLESLYGLEKNPKDESMLVILEMLEQDSESSIRAEAATALARYRDRKAIRMLLKGLDDSEFSVSYQSRESLRKLTGKDFGYDVSQWQSWLTTVEEPFSVLAGDYD
jgi:HEAT repeat protein